MLTYADFVDAREADVEDVIGTAFYLELVNAEYAAALGEPVAEKHLKSKHPRITVRLKEYFAENSLRDGVTFNHYRPARYLAEKVGDLTVPPAVLDRFERICSAVNERLPARQKRKQRR